MLTAVEFAYPTAVFFISCFSSRRSLLLRSSHSLGMPVQLPWSLILYFNKLVICYTKHGLVTNLREYYPQDNKRL